MSRPGVSTARRDGLKRRVRRVAGEYDLFYTNSILGRLVTIHRGGTPHDRDVVLTAAKWQRCKDAYGTAERTARGLWENPPTLETLPTVQQHGGDA